MKLAIIILLAIGHLASSADVKKLDKECREMFKAHPSKDNCLLLCILEKMDLIVDGKVSPKEIPTAKNCHNVQDDNKCELATKLHRCLRVNLNSAQYLNLFG